MKRTNPKTGKPFRYGETNDNGEVFYSYRTGATTNKDGFYYEAWISVETFLKRKEKNYRRSKVLVKNQTKAPRRINPITGAEFKHGDISEDGERLFSAYDDFRPAKDGFSKEVWYKRDTFQRTMVAKKGNHVSARKEAIRSKDYMYLYSKALYASRVRARNSKVPFDVDVEYLQSIYPEDGLCPVFGTDLIWGDDGKPKDNSPSLDRIIPSTGYVRGNLVWISNRANILKRDANWEELDKVATWLKSIVKHKKV